MSLLALRYAKAVFQVAEQQDAADAVDTDLARLGSALRSPEVVAAVRSPDTTTDARAKVVAILLGDAHELSKNLIGVVLKRRRQEILPDLSREYKSLLRAARGKVVGVVETAKPIDEAGIKMLEARAATLTGKNVTLEVEVNPDLIGGVRLRLGNTLYDGSVATVLEDLERSLMEAPL